MKRCREEGSRYRRAVNRTLWFEAAQAHLVGKWRNLETRVSLAGAKRNELKKTLDHMLADRDSYGPYLIAGIETELAHSEHQLDRLEAEYRRVAASRALDPLWPLLEAESVAKEPFEACRKKWEPKEPEAPYDVD
jgi:seryl-tRNA synthetase